MKKLSHWRKRQAIKKNWGEKKISWKKRKLIHGFKQILVNNKSIWDKTILLERYKPEKIYFIYTLLFKCVIQSLIYRKPGIDKLTHTFLYIEAFIMIA